MVTVAADGLTFFLTPAGSGALTVKGASGRVTLSAPIGAGSVATTVTRATANR